MFIKNPECFKTLRINFSNIDVCNLRINVPQPAKIKKRIKGFPGAFGNYKKRMVFSVFYQSFDPGLHGRLLQKIAHTGLINITMNMDLQCFHQ